jgi:hypothetical protein
MKKHLLKFLTVGLLFSTNLLSAQDGNRKIGVGLQTSFPVYGISAKIGITDQIMAQAIIAPFGGSAGTVGYSLNFYGARGIYRFTDADRVAVPYGFAGAGLIRSTFTSGTTSTSANIVGWSLGAGLEFFPNFLDNLGLSVELGYGSMSVGTGNVAFSSMTYGGGLHYYFN